MKRLLAGIICQIAGVTIMAAGLVPLVHVIQLNQPDARRTYYENTYAGYNAICSILIFLAGLAIGIILVWLGSRIKSKRDKGS